LEFFTRLKSRNEKSGLAYQGRDIADSINCFYLRVDIGNILLAVGLPAPICNYIYKGMI
jgi:hypothetical protein